MFLAPLLILTGLSVASIAWAQQAPQPGASASVPPASEPAQEQAGGRWFSWFWDPHRADAVAQPAPPVPEAAAAIEPPATTKPKRHAARHRKPHRSRHASAKPHAGVIAQEAAPPAAALETATAIAAPAEMSRVVPAALAREGRSVAGEEQALYLLAGPGIRTLADLRGRKLASVAVGGTAGGLVSHLLDASGVQAETLPLDLPDALDALWLGAVDAVAIQAREVPSELLTVDGAHAHLVPIEATNALPDVQAFMIGRGDLPNLVSGAPVPSVRFSRAVADLSAAPGAAGQSR